jgi:transcriptional regulator with XRE-family HTH domain
MREQPKGERAILASAMRSIRKMRRMSSMEVAREMGIAPRTYEHMESGQGRYSYDRLLRFSQATHCDVVALMMCVHLGDPAIAVDCANHLAMSIQLMAIAELYQKLGPDFVLLEQKTLVNAAVRIAKEVEENFAKRDVFAEHWLAERSAFLNPIRRIFEKPDEAT